MKLRVLLAAVGSSFFTSKKERRLGESSAEEQTWSGAWAAGNEHRKSVPNNPNAFIFAGERKGSPLNLTNLVRREMTAVIEKGKWHGWYGFRRGLATRLLEAQVQVEVIQEILRHSDPKVTQDSYIVIKSNATTKAFAEVAQW